MATKIGFDAKLAGTGVDWLSVGKDVASTLKAQEETREANRKAGAQAVADEIKALSATEMGKDAQANQWMADGINAISETALIDKRLWEKGALSTKDFMRNKTNRANGTNIVLQAYKKYNEDYGAIMEGVQSGELAGKTLQARAQIERLFDFGKTGMYINPLDSEVNVAEKELGEDGVYRMSKNPDKLLNASRLLQGATAKYYRFKADEEAAALAKGVATTILRTVGGTNIEQAYLAIDGLPPAEQKKLNSARKKQVQAMLTDDKAGSFLNDYLVEEGYSFTNDIEEAKKNDKLILMNQDGSNNFSENSPHGKAQMEYAVQEFDKLLEVYLPKKKQAPIIKPKSTYDQKSEEQTKIDRQGVEAWAGMYYGTPEEQKGFADRLLGSPNSRRQGLVEIDTITKPGTFILKYKDKTKNREIDVVNEEGTPISYADYIALGNEIHGIDDYGKALDLSGRKDATYTTERGGRSRREGSRKSYTAVDNQVNYRGEKINADNIIEEKIEENVADKEAINVIKDVFELQDLPTPNIEVEPGGKEISPSSTRVIPGASVPGYTPAVITKPSLKISVPGVTATPIYIPEGDGMKEILDKAIALIDEAYSNNKQLTSADFKTIFPSEEKFFEYNQENTTEQTPATGDKVKKQLPGKKQ